jgi:hypothetical protein
VERWAASQGLEVRRLERARWNLTTPWAFRASESQIIFRIEAAGRDGRVDSGWVRVGGWLFGLWVERVEARWDGDVPRTNGRGDLWDRELDG